MSDTKQAHTPEPWLMSKSSPDTIVFETGTIHRHDSVIVETVGYKVREANAARIVACVNAMAGIDDPAAYMAEDRAHWGTQ